MLVIKCLVCYLPRKLPSPPCRSCMGGSGKPATTAPSSPPHLAPKSQEANRESGDSDKKKAPTKPCPQYGGGRGALVAGGEKVAEDPAPPETDLLTLSWLDPDGATPMAPYRAGGGRD